VKTGSSANSRVDKLLQGLKSLQTGTNCRSVKADLQALLKRSNWKMWKMGSSCGKVVVNLGRFQKNTVTVVFLLNKESLII